MSTISAAASSTSTSTTSQSRTRLTENFDTFLTLLTTQLKNQSPADPLDTNQFTQQLVQFAQVEQQISSNDTLKQLLTAMQGSQTTAALGYLDRKVSFDSSQATPNVGRASWSFDPPESGSYQVRVRDQSGLLVASSTQAYVRGTPASFSWNGQRTDGQPIGSGTYTLELVRNGATVPVTQTGTVTRVEFSGSDTLLTVGGATVNASRIRSIGS